AGDFHIAGDAVTGRSGGRAANGGDGAARRRPWLPLDVEQARDDQQKIAHHGPAVGCDLDGKTKFAGGGGPPGEIAAALVEPQTLRQLAIDEAPRVGRRRRYLW